MKYRSDAAVPEFPSKKICQSISVLGPQSHLFCFATCLLRRGWSGKGGGGADPIMFSYARVFVFSSFFLFFFPPRLLLIDGSVQVLSLFLILLSSFPLVFSRC